MFGFGLVIGLFLGTVLGVVIMAMMVAAANADRHLEDGEVAADVASWLALTVLVILVAAVLLGPWWG